MYCYVVENLYQGYNDSENYANKNINLSIKKGDLVGFYGENGSGKSTLLRALAGLKEVTQGKIIYNNKPLTANANDNSISYCPQESLSLDFIPIIKLIELTAQFKGCDRHRATEDALYWLKKFDILNLSHKDLGRISGGQRKLVSLICSFIGDYDVLLLDEPTNELDPEKRKIVWSSIRDLNKDKGITIILATHEVNESQDVVKQVALFSEGELVLDESINKLKSLYEDCCKIRIVENSDKIDCIKNVIFGNTKFQIINESSDFVEVLLNREDFSYLDEIILKELDIKEYSVTSETLLDFLRNKRYFADD
jgi:ABC transporter related protein